MTENDRHLDVLQLHRDPVYPPSNGEEVRIWKTAQQLGEYGTVWFARPSEQSLPAPEIEPLTVRNPFLERKATRIYLWNALLAFHEDNPVDRVQTRLTVSSLPDDGRFDLVVCESPQMLRAGRRLARRHDAKLLLNKHNAMFELLDQQLRIRPVPGPIRRRAVANLRRFEQRGIEAADAVVFQSEDDPDGFTVPDDIVTAVINNGTEFTELTGDSDPERFSDRVGFDRSKPVCLFVGACDYDPNEDAARTIVDEIAPALPEMEFLIVGRDPPETNHDNVYTTGFVEDYASALAAPDIALCPLTMGSGTKLKMMDYLAAGLPIVTTPVGTQGIAVEDGETALVRSLPEAFVDGIEELAASPELRQRLRDNGRELGRRNSWESLLAGYDDVIDALFPR